MHVKCCSVTQRRQQVNKPHHTATVVPSSFHLLFHCSVSAHYINFISPDINVKEEYVHTKLIKQEMIKNEPCLKTFAEIICPFPKIVEKI